MLKYSRQNLSDSAWKKLICGAHVLLWAALDMKKCCYWPGEVSVRHSDIINYSPVSLLDAIHHKYATQKKA